MNITNEPKKVGERIKYLREKKGESQEKLGEAIGLSQNSISKLEKGETQLTLENQINIAKHFNVSHDYLCIGVRNDSILTLLEKYVSLKYENISDGLESFDYPVLQINKAFFDYLVSSARAYNLKGIPDDVREMWIKKVTNTFYEYNKKNCFSVSETVIPLPQQLFYADEQENDWKQTDLLREMNKQLLSNLDITK
ncbi:MULTISPECIES: helix-turn-helix transcriptional regulator [unclassified Clostridioides]|uniref:helix-turn-helix domain-containing protein n=1 Tax=unclassified Clostridioides TaxID=2635829 RepID=UPI001D12DD2F|nr:helix-turn-helix transcriptional regulator [Clostridioides sp. ES-S-0171-01]MCC0689475.1 helix-turn-helix transcriptional regulator [Clostridioides sp. ES-S-0056-01]UDN55839.1 helix-turn-helix transcriptional regulator [Clostridioides sp. ES-S-0054-01]